VQTRSVWWDESAEVGHDIGVYVKTGAKQFGGDAMELGGAYTRPSLLHVTRET
jgi:hypothetical protein